jgi:trigger factor
MNTTAGTVVEEGDTVNIDYTGYLDGEAFSGGSTNGAGADLELGSGTYIDGFEEQVEGHSVGETFDINVTFPDDYSATDLAGKEVTFNITINGVYE